MFVVLGYAIQISNTLFKTVTIFFIFFVKHFEILTIAEISEKKLKITALELIKNLVQFSSKRFYCYSSYL